MINGDGFPRHCAPYKENKKRLNYDQNELAPVILNGVGTS